MKVLITGITGMVGSHLAEYFLSSFPEIEVHGLVRWRSPLRNIQKILPRVRLHQGDLRDLNSLVVLLREVRPDRIHHLAAQSYVDMSFIAPADTLNSNIIGTVNLMDAVRIVEISPRIHICSSSEVYGQVLPDEVPIEEIHTASPGEPLRGLEGRRGHDSLSVLGYLIGSIWSGRGCSPIPDRVGAMSSRKARSRDRSRRSS